MRQKKIAAQANAAAGETRTCSMVQAGESRGQFKIEMQAERWRRLYAPALAIGDKDWHERRRSMTFRASDDQLVAMSKAGDVAITTTQPIEPVAGMAELTVQARHFTSALRFVRPTSAVSVVKTFSVQGDVLASIYISGLNGSFQLPACAKHVTMPPMPSKMEPICELAAPLLSQALRNVAYVTYGPEMPKAPRRRDVYGWCLRIRPGWLRAFGRGHHSILHERDGGIFADAPCERTVLFDRTYTAKLRAILPTFGTQRVTLLQSNGESPAQGQLLIRGESGITIQLLGHDPTVVSPDETRLLNRANPNQYTVPAAALRNFALNVEQIFCDPKLSGNDSRLRLTFNQTRRTLLVEAFSLTDPKYTARQLFPLLDYVGEPHVPFICYCHPNSFSQGFLNAGDRSIVQFNFNKPTSPGVLYFTNYETIQDGGWHVDPTNEWARDRYVSIFATVPAM